MQEKAEAGTQAPAVTGIPVVVISQARHDAVWEELNKLRNFRNYIRSLVSDREENKPMTELIEELEALQKKTHETHAVAFENVSFDSATNGLKADRDDAVDQAVLKELDESRKWIDEECAEADFDKIEKLRPSRNITIQRSGGKYSATMRRQQA